MTTRTRYLEFALTMAPAQPQAHIPESQQERAHITQYGTPQMAIIAPA
jgi:hypothetical protein